MSRRQSYLAAIAQAEYRRTRLRQSLAATKERARPGRLMDDAKGAIAHKAHDIATGVMAKAQERPWAAAAAGTALVAYLARRPIGSFLRRLFVRDKTGQRETDNG